MREPSTNHLIHETSPYLLQHAHNPVHWYPWGETALQQAKKENKPILLSIGYSACHWCHVMAHESFEDEETAKLMNQWFINIKVDREERPDLDKIYQTAHQLLNQRGGGWPLTVFLTPEQIPFLAGMYFPKDPRFQMPTFKEVLRYVHQVFNDQQEDIAIQNQHLLNILQQTPSITKSTTITKEVILKARELLERVFDHQHGGFGQAPKFPHPMNLQFMLHAYCYGQKDQTALRMVEKSLTAMAEGGIYDQIGGGFFRYSVDHAWEIPHFEKMLYDNAQLLCQYAYAYLITQNPLYRTVMEETSTWVQREMTAPHGGYYATLDADSEEGEGKYYVWDKTELEKQLSPKQLEEIRQAYNLNNPPNFENYWHLHKPATTKFTLPAETKKLLLQRRLQRAAPHRDEKILTAWNGLMIKAMTLTGLTSKREDLIDSAERAFIFIREHLYQNDKLLACYKDEKARFNGYLDDYAFLLEGVLMLLQARWDNRYLEFAKHLADSLLHDFEDTLHGGFFFTRHDHEQLLYRPKQWMDDAIPNSNAVAAYSLQYLGYLLGETRYLDAAERTLKAAWLEATRFPDAHITMLLAAEVYLRRPEIVILRGEPAMMAEWHRHYFMRYKPNRLVFAIPNAITQLPTPLADKKPQGKIVAYVCEGMQCLEPIHRIEDITT